MKTIDTYFAHLQTGSEFEGKFIDIARAHSRPEKLFPKQKEFLKFHDVINTMQKVQTDFAVIMSIGRRADFKTQELVLEQNGKKDYGRIFFELNEAILNIDSSIIPDNLLPFVTIGGKNPDELLPFIKNYPNLFKGIKIIASSLIPVNHDKYKALFKYCESKNLQVLVHCSENINSHLNFINLLEVANNFPGVNFIASHLGGDNPEIIKEIIIKLIKEGKVPSNLYLNTAINNYQALGNLVSQIGPDKLIYGSDIPFFVDNHKQKIIDAIGQQNIEQVFSGNPEKVFHRKFN